MLAEPPPQPSEPEVEDPYRPLYRMFGALILVAALLWLKNYDTWTSFLGKLLLIVSGTGLGWHQRRLRQLIVGDDNKSPLDIKSRFINYLIYFLAVGGLILGSPIFNDGFHLGKMLHWVLGGLALFYGGYKLMGVDKIRKPIKEDEDAG